MGVGKTTIGRYLASELQMIFKDSDREIEERTGASIPLIFELEGESGFRKRERAMIAELTQEKKLILATGGGVVLDDENRMCLKATGYVIYLHASVEQLLERTAHSHNRPLLKTENPRQRLEQILNERELIYKEVADATVNTGGRTVRQVVKQVLRRLEQLEKNFNEDINC